MTDPLPGKPTTASPQESEENFRSLFDAMAEMAVIHELVRDASGAPVDYRILDCNAAFTEVTGIPRERAVGALASQLYGTGQPPYFAVYVRVAMTGLPERFETYFEPMRKHFAVSVTCPRRGQFATLTHDVTQLRRLADELELDERRLDALNDLTLRSFDDEGSLVSFALEEAVRLTGSEIGYFHFVHPDGLTLGLHSWTRRVLERCTLPASGDRAYPLSSAGIWADSARTRRAAIHNDYAGEPGRRGYPEGHVAVRRHMSCPVLDGERVVAIAGVGNKAEPYDEKDARQLHLFFDGVWRRILRLRAEAHRRQLEQQMQNAQKLESLGVLAGGIAHDFNNLLATILGNIDLALEDLSPLAPARESILDARGASLRAADLVKQMLAYSGRGRFVVQPLDLGELVEEMTHILQVSISKHVVLRFNFAAGLPAVVADASQLRQVAMNLIINASEAIGARSGVITVSTGMMDCDRAYLRETWLDDQLPQGPFVYLEVADTGCGMDPQTRSKIFDPFYSTKMSGRGLGLSAVLGIVRSHKGAIKVSSEPGKGTTFKVLLPASGLAQGAPWRGSGRVLLVDDEETVRAMGKRMLERLGFEVRLAADGREALSLFAAEEGGFALVILDLTMPRLDGEETFRELRRLRADQPVVISSGYSEHEVTERFAGKGLAGFIQKPYQLATMTTVLRQVLGEA